MDIGEDHKDIFVVTEINFLLLPKTNYNDILAHAVSRLQLVTRKEEKHL